MPRAGRPSKTYNPPLTPDQAEALAALSGDCVYAATVGGGCLVVRVDPGRTVNLRAIKELEQLGLVEVVTLYVYEKRGT